MLAAAPSPAMFFAGPSFGHRMFVSCWQVLHLFSQPIATRRVLFVWIEIRADRPFGAFRGESAFQFPPCSHILRAVVPFWARYHLQSELRRRSCKAMLCYDRRQSGRQSEEKQQCPSDSQARISNPYKSQSRQTLHLPQVRPPLSSPHWRQTKRRILPCFTTLPGGRRPVFRPHWMQPRLLYRLAIRPPRVPLTSLSANRSLGRTFLQV
jgi:hypothetical protein